MVTSEKRARTAATIENRMKTMAERLEVKGSESVDSPSSNSPFFYTAIQKRPQACFPRQHSPKSTRGREAFRKPCGSEFQFHVVTAG